MLDHATVQRWVQQYSGKLLARVCSYNRNRFTDSWRLDETYLKVKGKWVYLYRMVDSNGETIDFYLSKTRDSFAAKRCVRGALRRAGFIPRKINSDGSPANALAVTQINAELLLSTGSSGFIPIEYTKIKYCNNILEQDHRRIKRITDPMLGFKDFNAAGDVINGIEAYAMLRKGQSSLSEINGIHVSIVDQFYAIAA